MPLNAQSIAVLICTHNRKELLQRCIEFLNEADRPYSCKLFLVVVANACTDTTHQFLQQYQDKADPKLLPLKWLEEPLPGKSNALNTALHQLEATVTALVDDDHRVDGKYFAAIIKALSNYPNADFFCGKILPDWDGSEPQWVHDQGKYRIYPLPVPRFDMGDKSLALTQDIAIPGGGNLVVKNLLFKRIGNFSTNLGPVGHNLGGGEDIDWVMRAYKAGAKLQYIPDIIQYHFVDSQRLNLFYIIKKAFERSFSVVRLSEAAKRQNHLFPRYLIRKTIRYFLCSLFSCSSSERRFQLVRLAATLGEIKGFLIAKKHLHE